MRTSILHKLFGVAVVSGALFLTACSGGGAQGSSATGTATVAAVLLDTTVKPSEVKSDNSDSIQITAYVVDSNKAPVEGASVSFSAGTGFLTASSGKSDADGKVTISFSAGPTDNSNRTEVVTATVAQTTITSKISIKVTGSSSIVMTTSSLTVKSDNSDAATISAVVLDANQQKVTDATVIFSAGTGLLGVNSGKSDANGLVTIPFSSGTTDVTNRTEAITATVAGTSTTAQIPIKVTGSTVALSLSSTNVQAGSSATLKATVKDASPTGVAGQTLRFSIPAGNGSLSGGTVGTGSATSQTVKSGSCGVTDTSCGVSSSIVYTPAIAGSVVVTVDWLNSAGNVTLTTSSTITVTSAGIAFEVKSPTTEPTSVKLGSSQALVVDVPTSISGATVSNVRFATTLGAWSNASKVKTVSVASNSASETLSGGSSSGNASIQIDALDASGNMLATLYRTFTLSAPSASAGKVTLQPSDSNVPLSSGGTINSTTLTATVRTGDGGSVVSGATVLFEIMNPTGSGESISPVIVTTDTNGQAKTTFSSGSQSTVGGLKIKASIVGTDPLCDNLASPAVAGLCDVKSIFVNGSGVSVSLGYANVLTSVNSSTDYSLAMSVLVVDNAGTAVKDTKVSLSSYPAQYYKGSRDSLCNPVYDAAYPKINEDVNENENLDAGEDTNSDGTLTPAHSTAGALPSTVTTDSTGLATFNLIYHKTYASWIQTRIRAKVVVPSGTTESSNELKFILPYSIVDANPCTLPPSPIGW